jgi:methionyl-tRNA synthetase
MSEKYYLTTPIYYVNAAPHIGHAYTTIAADTISRFRRMQGYETVLTTGTDEHGQKVERAAKAVGKTPQEFTDMISAEFRRQWETLGLAIDRFERTSSPSHHEAVKDLFQRCLKNGHIYKGSYTGQYCVYDELYVNEAGPGDPCPDCGRPTETVTEENYFFKLSAFQSRLLEFYAAHPSFIRPESRRNEVLAFVERGLSDLSISRTSIKWGIPVPAEGHHVFYVWFDALTSYMSAVAGENRWPADLHLIGKEILRFHAIYWPAFLMAAGLPLPKQIFAHGWLLFEQDKMSKSKGNIVRATPIQQVMGADALRYFLLREIVFGQDGNFSYDALVNRYNSDLANGLGNLASRTLAMIRQYRQGVIPASEGSPEIAAQAGQTVTATVRAFENLEFSKGLEALWALLGAADKYIVEQAPWRLAPKKDETSVAQLDATLRTAAEVLHLACVLLYPVIPTSAAKIWGQLGMTTPLDQVQLDGLVWGKLPAGQAIGTVAPVFPRIEAKVSIARVRALEEEEASRQAAMLGKAAAKEESGGGRITIEDFAKVEMKVGLVLSAERVKGSDKLLHMQIDIGESQPRSIVAGIAEAYSPEDMLGRKVVIVANLQPRKLRGLVSDGMVMAASPESGQPVLITVAGEVAPGTRLR